MSRLDELPPDQSAALSLLLRQHKSYADVAALLGIGEQAVRDRAHAALLMLASTSARELTPEQRKEIGDYMLSQQPGIAERMRTRTLLQGSAPARAWASELAAALAPLAGAALPEIPPAQPSSAEPRAPQRVADLSSTPPPNEAFGGAPSRPTPPPRSSRAAGAALLGVLAAVVIVAVVLLTNGGGNSHEKTTSTSASTTTSKKGKGPKIAAQITLKASHPGNHIIAVVYVLTEASKRAFFIAAQNLPETKHFYYALWLYDSPRHFLALSRSPPVGKSHSLAGGSALPANAGEFHEILLTEETREKPSHPGHVVMHGPFKVS